MGTIDESSQFVLPPDESLAALISFVPPKKSRRPREGDEDVEEETRSEHTAVSGISTARTADAEIEVDPHLAHRSKIEEKMRVSFSNGHVQTFPLIAAITQPYVVVDLPRVDLGTCHISTPSAIELGLTNPSEAEASWTLVHQPIKPA